MSASATVELTGRGLIAGYGRQPVVRGVDIRLRSGELVGMVGDNGAGKTTLFRVLAGALAPTAGRVALVEHVGDKTVTTDLTRLGLSARARLGIGYLPQRPALLWDATVLQNLSAALRSPASRASAEWKHSARPPKIDQLLEDFDLTAVAEVVARELSGGQSRRLEIARLAALGSRFVFCDEPLTGLDPEGTRQVQELLVRLCEHGAGVLVTDHRRDAVAAIAHRSVVVAEGLVTEGTRGTVGDRVPPS